MFRLLRSLASSTKINLLRILDERVYLIDFGLAKTFRDHTTLMDTPLVTGLDLVGRVRYTCIDSHMEV